jgi:ribosome-binding protein aMBF1 (putative translation factor)
MLTREVFCEVCGRVVEHVVDKDDHDGGELALCTRCGRLSSLPAKPDDRKAPPDTHPPCDSGCR